RIHKLLNRKSSVDFHNPCAEVIVRCMDRNRQVHLNTSIRKFLDFMCKTACRYRNMSCTNVEPFIVIQYIQKVHKVRKVIKRLPDSHDHNMADTLTISFIVKMFLYIHDLLDNFSARQVTAFL